jgi:hypothetical protein
VLIAFAAVVAAAAASSAAVTLVAVAAPVGFRFAPRSRTGGRRRFSQSEPALEPADKAERFFGGSLRGLGRPRVLALALFTASK